MSDETRLDQLERRLEQMERRERLLVNLLIRAAEGGCNGLWAMDLYDHLREMPDLSPEDDDE